MKPSSIATHPRPTRRQLLQAGALGGAGLLGAPAVSAAVDRASSDHVPLAEPFLFGACGHPHNTDPYNARGDGVPISVQVDMLSQMGVEIYRNDVPTDDSGHGNGVVHPRLFDLHGLLDAAGMEMFPMVYDNYSAAVSEQDNYNLGYAKGAGFAANYGDLFTHCNLGNEWTLFNDLKNGTGIGHQQSHYHLDRTARAMQWIRGANDGMKSVESDVQTSVAVAGWFPTWWQHYLLNNVGLDFIDWHWYADMERNIGALPGEIDSILDFVWDEFGLPIWITESNERADDDFSPEWNEQRQVNWYDYWFAECLNHPHCDAMFLYELLNEPPKAAQSFEEANFGLAKFPDTQDFTNWAWKRLGRQLTGADQKIGHFGSDSEGWTLGLGPEFPGAQGSFIRDNTAAVNGTWSGVLSGDFTGGGNYVQMSRSVALDMTELWLWTRSSDLTRITVRLEDSTGQTHQQRVPITPDNTWQAVHLWEFDSGQGYAHWGGANDGVWHGPANGIALLLGRTSLVSGQQTGSVRFDEVIATVP